ncbi:unnamed protein product [Closterium sp. NIES-53]
MLALCREHRLEHRTKHIALRYFLARELQQRGQLRLAYVASEANTADIFTKALAPGDHQRFCTLLACFALLDCTTQEFKLYNGKAVLKKNVFILDFVPDQGTADSNAIVIFTTWSHPPDLDPDFSPGGFWYSHTIPEAERTRVLAAIHQTTAAGTAAATSTSAAAKTTATTSTSVATETTTAPTLITDTTPTPAQQLTPAPRNVHRSANIIASFLLQL